MFDGQIRTFYFSERPVKFFLVKLAHKKNSAQVSLFLPLKIPLTISLLHFWGLLVGHTSPGQGSLLWEGVMRKVLLGLRSHDPSLLASIRLRDPQTRPTSQGCYARDGSHSPKSSVLSDWRGMRNQKNGKPK